MKHCLKRKLRPRNIQHKPPEVHIGIPLNQRPFLRKRQLPKPRVPDQPNALGPNNRTRSIVMLIGCEYTAYETTGTMQRLPGCHMDIHMTQKMLIEHYGYSREWFTIISDENSSYLQPTRANILQQLEILVQKCKNDASITRVVLYYSGHGTQTVDLSGDEDDGKDECIVPCDYLENGLILDDTFYEMFWSKMPLNVQITAIFDSCNSGTIFDLPFRYESGDVFKRDKKTTKSKTSTPLPLIVTISGCRDPQTSASARYLERDIEWEGAMSYALRTALKKFNYGPVGLNVLMDEIRSTLKTLKFSQVPQLGCSQEKNPSRITQLF